MRWLLILLLVPFVSADPWGCCVPQQGVCYDSTGFATQNAFEGACTGAGGTLQGSGILETCATIPECAVGCCCAGPEVFDSPTINSTESTLSITQQACTGKGTGYQFTTRPEGATCVQACGGSTGVEAGTHTVSGSVVNASDTSQALPGVDVFIPGGSLRATTDAAGRFTLTGIPQMRSSLFIEQEGCVVSQSEPFDITQNIQDVILEFSCGEVAACEHQVPTFAQPPRSVPGTNETTFIVGLQNSCGDLLQYEPFRCDENFENCRSLGISFSPVITDEGITPSTTYCYKVRARFTDGSTTVSTEDSLACITTGDSACVSRRASDPATWCGRFEEEDAVLSCDENNHIEAQKCGSLMCASRPTPQCVPAPECEKCNGLLGLFAKLDLKIIVGQFERSCSDTCLLDAEYRGSARMVDAYKTCLSVGSCADYKSRDACTAGTGGACGLQEECSWVDVNEELGQGLCVSSGEQACSACNDLGGLCNKETCEALGPCYYDGERNGLASTKGCLPREDMACRYYDTQAECGTIPAGWDVTYADSPSGTNLQTTESDDLLGLGTCAWNGQFCRKDADMRGELEDDCVVNNYIYTDPDCLADNTPPETTFYVTDGQAYDQATLRTLPHTVTDDRTPVDQVETYVCFSRPGESCYPTERLSAAVAPAPGTYDMHYFSKDKSGNMEAIRTTPLTIGVSTGLELLGVTIEEDTP